LDLPAAHAGLSCMFVFAWPRPLLGLGAAHPMEIPFVFDSLNGPHAVDLTGTQPPPTLAETMHAAWVRFATGGDPGWPAYDLERAVMVFREEDPAVVEDPRGDERQAWQNGG